MKMLSVTVEAGIEKTVRAQLESEAGVYIFREREITQPIYALGKQVTHVMFVLYVMDPEAISLLTLKYPYEFEVVSV